MAFNVGTWIVSAATLDPIAALRLSIVEEDGTTWGQNMGYGWTPQIEVKLSNGTAVEMVLGGAWEDTTQGAALFQVGNQPSLVPVTPNEVIEYDFVLLLTFGSSTIRFGSDSAGTPFSFRIKAWP